MERLAGIDVARKVRPGAQRLAVQALFGAACTIPAMALREAIDLISPGAGPFALIYPSVLIATLFGRWQAGLVALCISFTSALYFVLPPEGSFALTTRSEIIRTALNCLSATVVLLLAESFRRAVRLAEAQREMEIEQSLMLRMELEHRTKNNLALVSGLLQLQERRETDPVAKRALSIAAGRVASLAGAYAHLPISYSVTESVPIRPYLSHLVADVERAVFDQGVCVRCELADISLSRDKATVLGLYTNEALINCAKHAFEGGRTGTVLVSLTSRGSEWILQIQDNGNGSADGKPKEAVSSGLGSTLMKALAKQAGARHSIRILETGCTVELRGQEPTQREQSAATP